MSAAPMEQSELVLRGARFDVRRVQLAGRDGQPHPREVIVHPGAAVILPLLDDEHLVMIRNHRFAVDQRLWELPCGTLEPPESPQTCAARELTEETGYAASQLTAMCTFYTSPGICTEMMYAFAARGLTHQGQQLDAVEEIEVQAIAFADALAWIHGGQIRDGKTIAVLLHYHAFGAAWSCEMED